MLLDLIKFFEISEGAGGLLDISTTMPLLGVQIIILIGALALRLFLPVLQLQALREFYSSYLSAVRQDMKDQVKEVYGYRSYTASIKLILLDASNNAELFSYQGNIKLLVDLQSLFDFGRIPELMWVEEDMLFLLANRRDIDGIIRSLDILFRYVPTFLKSFEK